MIQRERGEEQNLRREQSPFRDSHGNQGQVGNQGQLGNRDQVGNRFKERSGKMIDAESISFSWGDREILNEISLYAEKGAFVGMIGPNGSGKSTFLKCVYRVLKQKEGCIYLDGRDVRKMTHRETAKLVGVVAQHNSYDFDFLVKDIVLMGRSPHKSMMERDNAEDYLVMRNALREVGLEGFESRVFASLSGGEQQRVILARALAQQTPVLVLDEPTNHLDIKFQLQLLKIVKSQSKTVLAAFHDLNIAAMYADVIYVMHQGRVYRRGIPSEVLTQELIYDVYGVHSRVMMDPEGYPYIQFIR